MCPNNVYKFPYNERTRANNLKGFMEQNKYLLQQQQRKMSELLAQDVEATNEDQKLLNKKPIDISGYNKYLIYNKKKAGGSKKKKRTRLCCRKTKRRFRE